MPKGDVLSQVILTISQIMWCRDLTEGLECEGDHLEALEEFENVNFEVSSSSERHCACCQARWQDGSHGLVGEGVLFSVF